MNFMELIEMWQKRLDELDEKLKRSALASQLRLAYEAEKETLETCIRQAVNVRSLINAGKMAIVQLVSLKESAHNYEHEQHINRALCALDKAIKSMEDPHGEGLQQWLAENEKTLYKGVTEWKCKSTS